MGFFQFLKNRIDDSKSSVTVTDSQHNPYAEKLLHTVTVLVDGEETQLELREIKNRQAQVMGGQSMFEYRDEKIPIVISAPSAETFSVGVNIAMPRELLSDFREELQRLQEEGLASPGAKLSYNPETKNAILFRRSEARIAGNLVKWRDVCDDALPTLINDTIACMPFIMGVYGE